MLQSPQIQGFVLCLLFVDASLGQGRDAIDTHMVLAHQLLIFYIASVCPSGVTKVKQLRFTFLF